MAHAAIRIAALILGGGALVLMPGCGKVSIGPTAFAVPQPIVTSVTVAPGFPVVPPGGSISFTSTVQGSDGFSSSVNWTCTGGTLTSTTGVSTTWTAPSASGSYLITATSVDDPSQSASASITVAADNSGTITGVTVTPLDATTAPGGTVTYAAAVQGVGTYSTGVAWTCTGGSLSVASGLTTVWTAPAVPGIYQITATSLADPSQSDAVLVTDQNVPAVTPPAPGAPTVTAVTLIANHRIVTAGETIDLTATVTGTGAFSTGLLWSSSGAGAFTATTTTGSPAHNVWTNTATSGTYLLMASSQADPTQLNVVVVTALTLTVP